MGTAIFVSSKIVDVVFTSVFAVIPKVVVTALSNPPGGYWVTNKSVNGFRLELTSNASIQFDWLALSAL